MNTFVKVMHVNTCNCAACASVPTLDIEMPYEEEKKEPSKARKGRQKLVVGENDLATVAPKVAAMLSEKDKHFAFEVTAGSKRKLVFVCPNCKQEFKAAVYSVARSVDKGFTGCTVCAGKKVVSGINDLASKYPKAAAMWSNKNEKSASEICANSGEQAVFVCPDCKQEFEARTYSVVNSTKNGNTGCPVCADKKFVPGINDLATKCHEAATMWSRKNDYTPYEIPVYSSNRAIFVCPDCEQEFKATVKDVVRSVRKYNTTGCPICAGQKVVPGINDLASKCPKAATMWSNKNKHSASEFTVKSNKKALFVCPDCKQEFETVIKNIVRSTSMGLTGCPVCASKKVVSGINDLASKCPKAATMWSSKNERSAAEVTVGSREKALFVCPDCKQEFKSTIHRVVTSVRNNNTGCPICRGFEVIPGINDLASKCPKAAAMWSSKNKCSAAEVTVGSQKKALFVCFDCKKEFKSTIASVVNSVNNGFTCCYDCNRRRINAISKPECFVVRFMLSFAGENGIANPFSDVQNILGDGHLGLDFVDHIQKFCAEYNGSYPHKDKAQKDRFKFEAARKAGYAMIRVLEPGLEVLDPKYDIVMPEGFYRNGKYDAEIMEEVGRKVINLLEEIYGRKASPEIWALNNFKEFEVWYDANKKELEANALKHMKSHKTAAKKAA